MNQTLKIVAISLATVLSSLAVATESPTRMLPIEGARNFRDLGGYQTQDGKTVKWRTIFRSNALNELTDQDLERVESLGIKTVCDLRSDNELESHPDRLPSNLEINYKHLNVQGTVAQATGKEFKIEEFVRGMISGEVDSNELMGKGYVANATLGAPMYAEIFKSLLEQKTPLVFHCQAGKDRAGVGAALILLVLGVDEATIIQDYMISNEVWGSMSDAELTKMAQGYSIPLEVLRKLMGTDERWMRPVFDTIKRKYGSYEQYFEQALGLSAADIEQLRSLYLES